MTTADLTPFLRAIAADASNRIAQLQCADFLDDNGDAQTADALRRCGGSLMVAGPHEFPIDGDGWATDFFQGRRLIVAILPAVDKRFGIHVVGVLPEPQCVNCHGPLDQTPHKWACQRCQWTMTLNINNASA